MNFIGIHITNQGISLSDGSVIQEDYLNQLFVHCKNYSPVFFDLDGSIASLLFLIGITKEQGKKLMDTSNLWVVPFHYTYFPQRFFSIDYGGGKDHPYINFANMNQVGYHDSHFTSDNSLEDALCKAKQAKETAEEIYKIFQKLGIDNGSIVSPTSAFLKKHSFNWPSVDDLPIEVSRLAYEAGTGQWFECFSQGLYDAWDFDLNASFLSIMAELPDIRRGEWIHINEFSPRISKDAVLGIASGILTTQAQFHPFVKKVGEDNYTPVGTFPRTMTLQDLRFLDKWNLGSYNMTDGWFWIPKGKQYQPYKGVMMNLWQKRQGTTGREKLIIQRVYSSLWGRSLEHHESSGFGEMFNPLIGLTVEDISRLKVAEACLQNNITPLCIMADGFISSQPVNLPISKNIGEWKLNAQGKCLIAGTAAVAFQGDHEVAELAIGYDDLLQQINDKPNAKEYKRTRWSPVTLALALEQNWNELGQIKPLERTLKIGNEMKRSYPIRPKTGKDLINNHYDSIAWDYSVLNT